MVQRFIAAGRCPRLVAFVSFDDGGDIHEAFSTIFMSMLGGCMGRPCCPSLQLSTRPFRAAVWTGMHTPMFCVCSCSGHDGVH